MARNGVSVRPYKNSKGEAVKGSWIVEVSLGVDCQTKKRVRPKTNFKGTKTQAIKEGERIKREYEGGLSYDGKSLTFKAFATQWHEERVANERIRSRTIDSEKYNLQKLYSVLGEYKLKDIKRPQVYKAMNQIRENKTGKRPLGGTTMNKIYKLLRQVLQEAVEQDLIIKNPCPRNGAPKQDTKERRALTVEEFNSFKAALDKTENEAYSRLLDKEKRMAKINKRFNRESVKLVHELSYLMALRLGLASGMRPEETFGLCWKHVSKDYTSIKVAQVLTSRGEIEPPKTEKSVREITLDADTRNHLQKWKHVQKTVMLSMGIYTFGNVPVCCSDVGGYASRANFDRWFAEWRKQNGTAKDVTYYTLRHTQATLLLSRNTPLKAIQARLGHSTPDMLLRVYAHNTKEGEEKIKAVMSDFMTDKAANY